MAVKTNADLKTDNNTVLSKIDNRYNHLITLKTLIDDVIDSKINVTGYTGQTSITTLGTINTGTWTAQPIADAYIASQAIWNAKLSNITGLVTQGSNVTITGVGTTVDPYVISTASGTAPTLTNTRIAFGSVGNTITDSPSLIWNGTSIVLASGGINQTSYSASGVITVAGNRFTLNVAGSRSLFIDSSTSSVSIGNGSGSSSGINNSAFGTFALSQNIGGSSNIGLGVSTMPSVNSASNELVIGSTTAPIYRVYFGTGGDSNIATYTQPTVNFYLTPSKGSNQAGGNYIINGGQSTGIASGGSVIIATAPAGANPTTLNSLFNRFTVDQLGNFGFNGTSFGGGDKVMFIANATTIPSTNSTGGGILYVEGGALKFRGSSGTITTLGVS